MRLPRAAPAEYSLTDDTYAKLLARVSERNFDLMTPDPRGNILRFYSDPSLPIERTRNEVRWQGVLRALYQKAVAPVSTLAGRPARRSSVSPRIRHPQPVERTGHTSPWPRLFVSPRLVWAIHMT